MSEVVTRFSTSLDGFIPDQNDDVRFLDDLGPEPIELECIEVIEAPSVTHLTYRAIKSLNSGFIADLLGIVSRSYPTPWLEKAEAPLINLFHSQPYHGEITMSTETNTHDLVMTHIFDAPVEQVWNAWIDPEKVMGWWGPDHFTSPSAEIDFREGGTSLLCMRAPQDFGGQDMYSTWTYTKIVPMERFEYIHKLVDKEGHKIDPTAMGMPADFPQDQPHLITFRALGDNKTEVTVTEYGWTPGQMMEMSRMGMEQCLNKMAAILK